MKKICFVCMGNICRSPLAEGVFKHLIQQAKLDDRFQIESAAIGSWHVGEAPDTRAQRAAQAHGIRLDSAAQQFQPKDFSRFDAVLALDGEIAADLHRLAPTLQDRQKIRLLREYDPLANGDLDVPDPYYGRQEDFERAYQLIERACEGLLKSFK